MSNLYKSKDFTKSTWGASEEEMAQERKELEALLASAPITEKNVTPVDESELNRAMDEQLTNPHSKAYNDLQSEGHGEW